VILLKK